MTDDQIPGEPAAPIVVDHGNFVRAETNRMFAGLLHSGSGLNSWTHNRGLTPIDQQTVIRMNRDTLYSLAVVDISQGATVTVPDAGDRYLSVMVVNQDHYINRIFHDRGTYELTVEEFDTEYVTLGARVLVNGDDSADLAAVAAIQDGFGLEAAAARPFVLPDYDEASFSAVRNALLEEVRSGALSDAGKAFGSRSDVDPHVHLIGTAAGWGGLPAHEAFYLAREPELPVGAYELKVGTVPVDAFWSLTVYNRDGFLEANDLGVYSINSLTGHRDTDGSITVRLGGDPSRPNCLPLTDGWNYTVRLYRPRPEILDGSWVFPEPTPVETS
jgi:hypothetical protein